MPHITILEVTIADFSCFFMVSSLNNNSQVELEIAISEQDGVRSLHLGGDMIQSAMKVSAPNDLVLGYTQCMMAFLLFHRSPKTIHMIGLGGGSLAKFAYHYLPDSNITVVEINPQVVATALNHFELPTENNRLNIYIGEGAEHVANHPLSVDVLMIDGFDDDCQVPTLCNQAFYNQTREALNKNGILVINLLSRDKNLGIYLRRIENSFNGHVVAMLSEIRGNLLVFAFKHSQGKLAWKTLKARAKTLEKAYPLPFTDFVSKLRKYNTQNGNFLDC